MATSIRLIRRYVWLVDTIRRAGSITLQDINRKWAYNTSLNIDNEDEIPERTFHRHRDAIAELFDIEIGCNRYDGNKYYIKNEEALEKPSFTTWLFNGLSIDNQMVGNREISERIVFEDTPGGNEFLSPIIESLSNQKIISITYKRFNSSDSKEWFVEPTLIKQSNRRWYLIGRIKGYDNITVFALDRIQTLDITDQSYTPENLKDIKTRLNEVIGVNIEDDYDCEPVVIRVYGKQRAYIDCLPLHSSQRVKETSKDFTDYELTIKPEYEFQREILKLGTEAEIISPCWLRDEIKWQAEEIIKRYDSIGSRQTELSPNPDEKPKTAPDSPDGKYMLFLDFDGVLNTARHYKSLQRAGEMTRDEYGPLFDPGAIEALRLIVEHLNSPDIIITSSWRYHLTLNDLRKMWIKREMPGKIYGMLPRDSYCDTRGEEIKEYLLANGRNRPYLILDDEDSYSKDQQPHCIIVDAEQGLSKNSFEQYTHLYEQ